MIATYRRAREADLKFICYSWVRSYRTAHAAGMIADEDWRDVMTPQVVRVMGRPAVELWVACHPEDTDPIADLYGWIAVEHGHDLPLVHYIYVKLSVRREGLARGLFAVAGVRPLEPFFHTCKTGDSSSKGLRLRTPQAEWKPSIARQTPKDHTQEARKDHGQYAGRNGGAQDATRTTSTHTTEQ